MNSIAHDENDKLTGYIEHRLQFASSYYYSKDANTNDNACNNQERKLKRKLETLETFSTINNDREDICSIDHDNCYVGFYFINVNNEDEKKKVIRLIAPQSMMKIVCDVARYRAKVSLKGYSMVSWIDDNDNDGDNHDKLDSDNSASEIKYIELHHDGVVISPSSKIFGYNCISRTSSVMSLLEMQKLEESMFSERIMIKNEGSMKGKKKDYAPKLFSIRGKVDAISSIIAIVPTDPFAMIELYDPHNPCVSTVVILKGKKALTCQPAILPGDNLIFRSISRSRWHVPQSLQKEEITNRLHGRAPSHVFVVTDPLMIQWESPLDMKLVKRRHIKPTIDSGLFDDTIVPPLPSTIHSLFSIRGKVTSIKYTEMKWSQRHCRQYNSIVYVKLVNEEDEKCKQYYNLYLLYYQMSPDLQFGLTVGAIVSAINVHRIPSVNIRYLVGSGRCNRDCYEVYGACLRSTVTILIHSNDTCITENLQKGQDYKTIHKRKAPISFNTLQDQLYVFNKVITSYMELEWMSRIKSYMFNNIKSSSQIYSMLKRCLAKTIPRDEVSRPGTNTRDPYREWFDHGCDDEISGCYDRKTERLCSSLSTRSFPIVVSSSQLVTKCKDVVRRLLASQPQFSVNPVGPTTDVDIGWTQSFLFNSRQFANLSDSDDGNHDVGVYLGGVIAETTHDGKVVSQLHDESIQVPVVPIKSKYDYDSNNRFRVGDFALIQVDRIVVSSFYLGRYNMGEKDEVNSDHSMEMSSLSPLLKQSTNVNRGPCQFCFYRGHLFLLSIQIHYKENFPEISASNASSGDTLKVSSLTKFIHKIDQPNLNEISGADAKEMYVGSFVRLHWKSRKLRDKSYTGCSIKLSYLPTEKRDDKIFCAAGVMQSADITLTLPIVSKNIETMKDALNSWPSLKLNEDILALSCGWRVIAESTTCPLVIDNSNSPTPNFMTKVFFSITKASKGQLNSYKTSRVDLVQVNLVNYKDQNPEPCFSVPVCTELNASSGMCMSLPGALNSRIRPIIRNKGIERADNFHGIPSLNISNLIYRLYHDLSCNQLVSQLVFRIANAKLSTLKFCSVRIQCTNCYQYLTNKDTDISDNFTNQQSNTSFWDRPLPIASEIGRMMGPKSISFAPKSVRTLVCPNGCNENHAAVKWEVSGFVDDSTGLAKLYAERDMALMLLGTGLDANLIEKGAWLSSKGIVFQRGIPLGSHIQSNYLRKLSTIERAKVALYHHCIKSLKSTRKEFDLVCRCKKLLNSRKQSLNRFELSATSALGQNGKVVQLNHDSTSSPMIELQLVDCISCLEKSVDVSWSIVKLLQR